MKRTMDGNEAAAYASYAFTEVAAIYPITPSSPMAESVDAWASMGRKNIFGQKVSIVEMQSEAGAISAVHGALEGGSLATTYTSSQGLALMIPTLFRIAGEMKPCVVHVASRVLATNAIAMFAEHSDVMACRPTGVAMLASSCVQEAMDLGAVAHLASIHAGASFLHFFDGFRTSHEIQKVDLLDYGELAKLVDCDKLREFRDSAADPEHPVMRTGGLNPETYFQAREACNTVYDGIPEAVEHCMEQINALTGKDYHIFNYYGDPNARYVALGMGSVCGTARETVEYLSGLGYPVGYLDVHLYRPFCVERFDKALPATARVITVLDRTKEPGAVGEPLYEEVCAALNDTDRDLKVLAGRFGLCGKDTTPGQLLAVYRNMMSESPKSHFTVGIEDDVTGLSLPVEEEIDTVPEGTVSCKFWGLGSDGTVSANKNSIKMIGDHTDLNVQAYFEYDGRKSGGVTRSHLRFGKEPILSSYYVRRADFVACHNEGYLAKYDMIDELRPGGVFLLACAGGPEEVAGKLPDKVKRYAAKNKIRVYSVDAAGIAERHGLGNRINTVLQAAFFKLTGIIPYEDALRYMKESVKKSYMKKGEDVVRKNCEAIDEAAGGIVEVPVPAEWAQLEIPEPAPEEGPDFVRNILRPVNSMNGDKLPVSVFKSDYATIDGSYPAGTSKYEKRAIAVRVPRWDMTKCLQCNLCALVCPHAAIRPFLTRDRELPEGFKVLSARGKGLEGYGYRVQVDVLDCTGCGSCAEVCPAKDKALTMEPLEAETGEIENWDFALTLEEPDIEPASVKMSQFRTPLLEFSGACAGCGETPYAKLVTQLYGDRMYVVNATGCSSVWACSFPSFPYTANRDGRGPSFLTSLFENNAEFGYGVYLSCLHQREELRRLTTRLLGDITISQELRDAASRWLEEYDRGDRTVELSERYASQLRSAERSELSEKILARADKLAKKSVWLFGGDGWAYDIGYGGLDHVLASGADLNIMVFDTEMYSNTGGQASKATPAGAVAKFAASGKETRKKDLGMMAMSYGNVYVAQVSMGADPAQLLKAVREAEAYPGTSLILCYSPCISHGIRGGMGKSQLEMKKAVETGYWPLYRYDPRRRDRGEEPFVMDSGEPTGDYKDFLRGEARFTALKLQDGERAEELYERSCLDAQERRARYARLEGPKNEH